LKRWTNQAPCTLKRLHNLHMAFHWPMVCRSLMCGSISLASNLLLTRLARCC
jgi:hypothetical protein